MPAQTARAIVPPVRSQAVVLRRPRMARALSWSLLAGLLLVGVLLVAIGASGRLVGLAVVGSMLLLFTLMGAVLAAVLQPVDVEVDARCVRIYRSRHGRPIEFPRQAVAGFQVTYQDKSAILGAVAGGAIGAAMMHGSGKPGGSPLALQVWTKGATKAKAYSLARHKKEAFQAWLRAVQALGIPVHHGE